MQLDPVFTNCIDAVLRNIGKRDILHGCVLDMTHDAADNAAMSNHNSVLFNRFKPTQRTS